MGMNVGIFVFHEVEVLDFAGPFEVLSITEVEERKPFNVFLVSEKDEIIRARNGLQLKADYQFENHPLIDMLIVPGGYGAEQIEVHNEKSISWIRRVHEGTQKTCSVCTGAFLLAKAGIIDKHQVTTHWMDAEELQRQYPKLEVLTDRKFVDQGDIITSGGISCGIEMSLYLVAQFLGPEAAEVTARRMVYPWHASAEQ